MCHVVGGTYVDLTNLGPMDTRENEKLKVSLWSYVNSACSLWGRLVLNGYFFLTRPILISSNKIHDVEVHQWRHVY